MNANNDTSNMLYSILVFISAFSGALNLYYLAKLKGADKECDRLREENHNMMKELNALYNEKPVLKNDTGTKQ